MAKTIKKTAPKAKKVAAKPAPKEEYYLVAGYGKIAATSQEDAEQKVAAIIAKGI